jgi:hypothetical protein
MKANRNFCDIGPRTAKKASPSSATTPKTTPGWKNLSRHFSPEQCPCVSEKAQSTAEGAPSQSPKKKHLQRGVDFRNDSRKSWWMWSLIRSGPDRSAVSYPAKSKTGIFHDRRWLSELKTKCYLKFFFNYSSLSRWIVALYHYRNDQKQVRSFF